MITKTEDCESLAYMQDTLRRISLALGYDGQTNKQCWDWINAVSERWGNDDLDARLDFCLKYHKNTGYLACSGKFKKEIRNDNETN